MWSTSSDMTPMARDRNKDVVRIPDSSACASRVLVVLVLYKRGFNEVPGHEQLVRWLSRDRPVLEQDDLKGVPRLVHGLIYDNSPMPQDTRAVHGLDSFDVVHDPSNGGTRAAYLHALDVAVRQDCDWVLFLDHDTQLPVDYFLGVRDALSSVRGEELVTVGAVVPRVADHDQLISPATLTPYGRVKPIADDDHAKSGGFVTAIASATLVRVQALQAIMPIPEVLSLDYLDHWLFRALQMAGWHILVSSSQVQHALSVMEMRTMGAGRYQAILAAESFFLQGHPGYSSVRHSGWLVVRCLKMLFAVRRPDLSLLCLQALWRAASSK